MQYLANAGIGRVSLKYPSEAPFEVGNESEDHAMRSSSLLPIAVILYGLLREGNTTAFFLFQGCFHSGSFTLVSGTVQRYNVSGLL
ncbi:hypothetical protein KC347_g317 [Hortaea werneckii]|nr:hypothetical protein KC347_g317 [Hortaea werneckii]